MGMLVRRLLHAIRRRRAERELREELEFHLALKRQDLEKAGLDSLAAEAEARRAMGSRLLARDDARDVWALPWLSGLALDVKLALRLMARHPLLTIVGGAAMAFGMAVGVGGFEVRTQFVDPVLPLDEGDRIVGLRTWDVRLNRPGPVRETDLVAWHDGLQSIAEIGAFAQVERNLIAGGVAEPVRVAAMTASGFRIARVRPLLGRTLVEADELTGAVPVVVIAIPSASSSCGA